MYESFARRSGLRSLELGVGSGRVALHLARRGFEVVGVDSAQAMLERLRARLDPETAPRLHLVHADMRAFDLAPQRFGLIYCAAGTFQHLLTHDDQLAALACVRRHLAPDGRFVCALRSPRAVDWTVERTPLELRLVRRLADGDELVQMHASSADAAAQTTTTTYLFDRTGPDGVVRRRVVQATLRYTGLPELKLLLERAGLRLAGVYEDADLSPYRDDSDTMIVVGETDPGWTDEA